MTGEPYALPAALDLSAYRIVQEAVTNALKHSQGSRLDVGLRYLPREVEISIRDDGRGVLRDALAASTGHGLIGMEERVKLFGGDLSTSSSELGGFSVRARLPITGR